MNARQLFERGAPAPAPVAPPKPGVKPGAPPAPAKPAPSKFPNPFRRRTPGVSPGPMPKPKACVEGKPDRTETRKPKAKQLFTRPEDNTVPFRERFGNADGVTRIPFYKASIPLKKRAAQTEAKARTLFGR